MNIDIVRQLKANGVLSYIDIHFARLMEDLSSENPDVFLAAALASSQARAGNICLNLNTALICNYLSRPTQVQTDYRLFQKHRLKNGYTSGIL